MSGVGVTVGGGVVVRVGVMVGVAVEVAVSCGVGLDVVVATLATRAGAGTVLCTGVDSVSVVCGLAGAFIHAGTLPTIKSVVKSIRNDGMITP